MIISRHPIMKYHEGFRRHSEYLELIYYFETLLLSVIHSNLHVSELGNFAKLEE